MELIVIKLIFALTISFLITLYLIPLISTIAHRLNEFGLGTLDIPDGTIKKHEKPIPYLGGVAIFVGFIVSLSFTLSFENQLMLFLIGTTLLLFIGLVDDLVVLKPYQKFSGQFIAAFCLVRSGFYLKESFFLYNFWSVPLSLFWILSVVNAFNLVDIMDGLASTIAVGASAAFLIIACLNQQWQVALLLSSFLGPLVAFLWYNKPPAHIYLGDAGSLFIGGILATVPFLLKWSIHNFYGFVVPAIVLAIPLLEVASLILVRSYKRIPFYKASPDHFALYLRNNGWSKNLILIYIFTLSLGLFCWSYLLFYNEMSFIQFVVLSLLFLFVWLFFLGFNFILCTFKLFWF